MRFNLEEICDRTSSLPRAIPSAEQFTDQVQKVHVGQPLVQGMFSTYEAASFLFLFSLALVVMIMSLSMTTMQILGSSQQLEFGTCLRCNSEMVLFISMCYPFNVYTIVHMLALVVWP